MAEEELAINPETRRITSEEVADRNNRVAMTRCANCDADATTSPLVRVRLLHEGLPLLTLDHWVCLPCVLSMSVLWNHHPRGEELRDEVPL